MQQFFGFLIFLVLLWFVLDPVADVLAKVVVWGVLIAAAMIALPIYCGWQGIGWVKGKLTAGRARQ